MIELINAKRKNETNDRESTIKSLTHQRVGLETKIDQLLNLRLSGEIDADWFAQKSQKLRDEQSRIAVQLEHAQQNNSSVADIALKVVELSQNIENTWLTADFTRKRQLLETYPARRKSGDFNAKALRHVGKRSGNERWWR